MTTSAPATSSTSSAPSLEPTAIDRGFQVYMNGLANLHGHYVERWEMLPYSVPSGQEFVTVQAKVTQRNARSGKLAGDVVYSWYVERNEDTSYYVCGWLDYE